MNIIEAIKSLPEGGWRIRLAWGNRGTSLRVFADSPKSGLMAPGGGNWIPTLGELMSNEWEVVPKPPDVGGPSDLAKNWTGWGKDESNCPKCGSKETEELDASTEDMTAGKMHCNSCGFEGNAFLY